MVVDFPRVIILLALSILFSRESTAMVSPELRALCPFEEKAAAPLFAPAELKKKPLREIQADFSRLSDTYGNCQNMKAGTKGYDLSFRDATIPMEATFNADGKITKLNFFPAEFRSDNWIKITARGVKIYPQGFSFVVADENKEYLAGYQSESAFEVGDNADLFILKEIRAKIKSGEIKSGLTLRNTPLEKQLELMMLEKNEAARTAILGLTGKKRRSTVASAADLCETLFSLKGDPILKRAPSVLRRSGSWEMVAGISSWIQGVRQVTEILSPPGNLPPRCLSITLNATSGVEIDRSEEIFLRIFSNLPENYQAP